VKAFQRRQRALDILQLRLGGLVALLLAAAASVWRPAPSEDEPAALIIRPPWGWRG
jgi:hypothetical protein